MILAQYPWQLQEITAAIRSSQRSEVNLVCYCDHGKHRSVAMAMCLIRNISIISAYEAVPETKWLSMSIKQRLDVHDVSLVAQILVLIN